LSQRQTGNVIGAEIDSLSWAEARSRIAAWAGERRSRVVFICNAHSVVTARRDPAFAQALRAADMATPDGSPVAWMLRRQGYTTQERINGPDLMWHCCADAQAQGLSIYLYGGLPQTLHLLRDKLLRAYPDLRIAGSYSPPFRPLTVEEDAAAVADINASGAGIVWVSLGCPKQEMWMHKQRGRVQAVMVGVGAAFDYHAGVLARAPLWAQRSGLEWLHRLLTEPRRLWRRYLVTNTLFILAAAKQLLIDAR
jgi:N-acetylglucosaminyldiphosphoundecaprenol N-acetyl-beta-D-mannosaminyltransferase